MKIERRANSGNTKDICACGNACVKQGQTGNPKVDDMSWYLVGKDEPVCMKCVCREFTKTTGKPHRVVKGNLLEFVSDTAHHTISEAKQKRANAMLALENESED